MYGRYPTDFQSPNRLISGNLGLKGHGGPTQSKAMSTDLRWVRLIAAATDLSMESNFPYVRGIRPLDAGTTKAGFAKGAGTKLKACLRAV